jgi:hypothetical protein
VAADALDRLAAAASAAQTDWAQGIHARSRAQHGAADVAIAVIPGWRDTQAWRANCSTCLPRPGGKVIWAGLRGCGCGAGTGGQQREAVTVLP